MGFRNFLAEVNDPNEIEYKGYTVRVVDLRKKNKGFGGIAYRTHKGKTDEFTVRDRSSADEVRKELMDYVDSKRSMVDNSLEQFKSGNITLFFNAPLSRQVFGPDAVLYADIESINGVPHLLISDQDQGGMAKVYDRNVNKVTGKGMATFYIKRAKAIKAGLTLSRYDLGREIDYELEDVKAFKLLWHSDVIPDEPIRLEGPGLTVSPPIKGGEMIETELMMQTAMILEDMIRYIKKPRLDENKNHYLYRQRSKKNIRSR
jgi:hypothetical protein